MRAGLWARSDRTEHAMQGSSSSAAPRPRPDRLLQGPTWDGSKMYASLLSLSLPHPHHNFSSSLSFNIYVLDYLKKRGYHKTATQLVTEAHIPTGTKPPINAPEGLLFELIPSFLPLLSL
jgi:hypothetical protein